MLVQRLQCTRGHNDVWEAWSALRDDDWVHRSYSEVNEFDLHLYRYSAHSAYVRRGDLAIQSDWLASESVQKAFQVGYMMRSRSKTRAAVLRRRSLRRCERQRYKGNRNGRIISLLREVGNSNDGDQVPKMSPVPLEEPDEDAGQAFRQLDEKRDGASYSNR